DILLGLQTGPRREATPQVLSKIKAPTLVMFGQKDTVIPATDGDRFAAAIPGSTLIVYPDVAMCRWNRSPTVRFRT
ncbi:MAG: hypothetical protein B7Y78_14265, partial [Caulobacter sp. 35-67-4]